MSVAPDKAVFTAALVTLTSTVGGTVAPEEYGGHGELPSARMLIGTSITFMGLSIITDIAPKVGVGLSVSIAVTALIYYGIPVADGYFNPQHTPKSRKGKNK